MKYMILGAGFGCFMAALSYSHVQQYPEGIIYAISGLLLVTAARVIS